MLSSSSGLARAAQSAGSGLAEPKLYSHFPAEDFAYVVAKLPRRSVMTTCAAGPQTSETYGGRDLPSRTPTVRPSPDPRWRFGGGWGAREKRASKKTRPHDSNGDGAKRGPKASIRIAFWVLGMSRMNQAGLLERSTFKFTVLLKGHLIPLVSGTRRVGRLEDSYTLVRPCGMDEVDQGRAITGERCWGREREAGESLSVVTFPIMRLEWKRRRVASCEP
jgi:hypothetical protein